MILKELKINTFVGDPTNCYIIFDEKSKEIMCIDPAGEAEKIEYMIKNILKGKLKYIYLTHCHGDHIGGVTELKQACGGKILIHRDDSEGLNDKYINLSGVIDIPEITLEADSRVDDGDLIHLGDLEFRVIHTPGHTKGGVCYYFADYGWLISGDTLFQMSIGRTDFPTGNLNDLLTAIREKLFVLPPWTKVLSGHTPPTTIEEESRCNPFLQ